MKKSILFLFFILSILFSIPSQAGSSGCTNTSSLSWYQANPYTTLTSSQCIINSAQQDSGTTSLLTYLPSAPSDGDTFTLKDTTDYSLDTYTTWYSDPSWGGDGNTYSGCYPAGFGFQGYGSALVGNANDGYAQSDTMAQGFYFTSCDVGDVTPGSNSCSSSDFPPYYGNYPKVRYAYTATFNASTGNWDTTSNQL